MENNHIISRDIWTLSEGDSNIILNKIKYTKNGITNKNLPIHIEVFPNTENLLEIKTFVNGKLISRVLSEINEKKKTIDIVNSLVYPEYKRRGVYTFVVDEIYEIAKKYDLKIIEKKNDRGDDANKFWKNRLNESSEKYLIGLAKKSKTIEEFLNLDWDKIAFGFSDGEIIKLMPSDINIKWVDDLENAEYKINNVMRFGKHFKDSLSKLPPVEVSINEDGKFYLEDGHHRYVLAKKENKSLNAIVEIKANPFEKLNIEPQEFYMKHAKKQLRTENYYNNTDNYFQESLTEDYIENGDKFSLEKLNEFNSFAARKRYVESNLPRISAGGSSRLVYDMGDNKVLKLAANQKGLAQNYNEASIGTDNYFNGTTVTEVYDAHPDDFWIVSEKATRLTPTQFKNITDVSIEDTGTFLHQKYDENRGGRLARQYKTFSDEKYEELNENEFLMNMVDLMYNYDIVSGDLGRISSYGLVNKNGTPTVVLLDYGSNTDTIKQHYSRRNEGLYDDIGELSNTENTVIRDGGYAGAAYQSREQMIEDLEYNHVSDAKPENDNYIMGGEFITESNIMELNKLPFINDVESVGGKIFAVGGAVRDEFLGKESKDLDILVTNIPLDKLETILSKYGKVNSVGKSFGILKFIPNDSDEEIDVAIPRSEKPTGGEGHKAFEVKSDHNLSIEDDLFRRDFTINAIAKDINGNIIDPYGGVNDMKQKVIKLVNPDAFSDDPLRMLRAVQFASRFGFTIENNTLKQIQKNANRIKEIPPERILIEFDKIIKKGDISKGLTLLKQTGLLKNIFNGDSGILVNSKISDNIQTMGEFIWFIGHNLTNNISDFFKDTLKGDINTAKEIKAIDYVFKNESDNKIKNRLVVSNALLISPIIKNSKILSHNILTTISEITSNRYPIGLKELKINGNDLINLGIKGDIIGKTLNRVLLMIYSDKLQNNKEDILGFIKVNQINEEGGTSLYMTDNGLVTEEPHNFKKNDAGKLLELIIKPLNLDTSNINFLGSGNFGYAYDIGNGKVLKITTDKSEAIESLKLQGKKLKRIANIYGVFKKEYEDKLYYIIVLEKLDRNNSTQIFYTLNAVGEILHSLTNEFFANIIQDYMYNGGKFNIAYVNEINSFLKNKNKYTKLFLDLIEIADELLSHDIMSIDFVNDENLGYKNGLLSFFDLGFSDSSEFDYEPKYIGESANFSLTGDDIKRLSDKEIKESLKFLINHKKTFRTNNKVNYRSDEYLDELTYSYIVVSHNSNKFYSLGNKLYGDIIELKDEIGDYLRNKGKLRRLYSQVNEDRLKSYMPNSQRVKIKTKCIIGGNGDGTSTACNQGEIDNLELSSINENNDPTFIKYAIKKDELAKKRDDFEKYIDNEINKVYDTYIKPHLSERDYNIVLSQTRTGYDIRNSIYNEKLSDKEKNEYNTKVKKLTNLSGKYGKYILKQMFDLDNKYKDEKNAYGLRGDKNANYVYHITTTSNAISILQDGEIYEGEEGGVATTTNKDLINKINPIFYHPSHGGDGVTYKNLSTTFVFDFRKIKNDGIKYFVGDEEIGTQWGEEEIRILPKTGRFPVFNYLVKVIYDPSKEKDKNIEKELVKILKDKNIKFYSKGNINESIDMEDNKLIEYGCLMVDFSHIKNWENILSIIKKDDIYDITDEYGLEKEPHITVLYGFHDEINGDMIKEILEGKINFPIKVEITGISIFENPEYDVVKFDVVSDDMVNLNKIVSELPNTNEFGDYKPHMTISYVKKGTGFKYIKKFKTTQNFESYRLYFSDKNKNKMYFTSNDL